MSLSSAFANTRIDWKETSKAYIFKADIPRIKMGRSQNRSGGKAEFCKSEVKANMEKGVLTVTVPKMEEKKPEVKSIDISG
ncbi:17.7 kDa class I heat shock protein-like [Cucumis melo var. makuwa]|uniref:17.7 kDa class I heat shock protein-like n=1 Tax=Cucumis melo var. makuwa TaxID=1194695 RepID=A0A5A7U837_CUCMM|nr:17.7 kDa class I heat shock protein-like [Cucumis melo var. makuwa]